MTSKDIQERIWLIPNGIPLKLDGITIQINSDKLPVADWTSTIHFENITREMILIELDDLKNSYSELSKSFNELNEIVTYNNLTIEFHVAYDDAGKDGIGLCSEINGKLNWYIN